MKLPSTLRTKISAFCIPHSAFIPLSNDHTLKPMFIGLLAARGIQLASDATDQTVTTEINKLINANAALANDHDPAAQTALANEREARKAERAALASVIVDRAIHAGIKPIAERDTAIAALINSADMAVAADTLLKTAPALKTTTNGMDRSGKQSAGLDDTETALQKEYKQAFETELQSTGQNPARAHQNIMTQPKYSALAQKLLPKQ